MSEKKDVVLEVDNLRIDIPVSAGLLHPVRGISFDVSRGETLCIVGESGCGKSLTSLAIMGLLPKNAERQAHRLNLLGEDIRDFDERLMGKLRGVKMGMIFQEPMTSLNPSYTIGNQLEEVYLRHMSSNRLEARERAIFLLDKVGISSAGIPGVIFGPGSIQQAHQPDEFIEIEQMAQCVSFMKELTSWAEKTH